MLCNMFKKKREEKTRKYKDVWSDEYLYSDKAYILVLEDKLEAAEEDLKRNIDDVKDCCQEYKVVFRPTQWNDEKDFKVCKLTIGKHRFGYDTIKAYDTREEAEAGLELIKEEMAKN